MKIFITGISGTGKTTLGRNLKEKGFSVIDIDEDRLCHWYNKETGNVVDYKAELNKDFISKHSWMCDIKKLKDLIDISSNPVFIIGMPENIDEIISISDKIIILKCSPETFISRILEREDNDFGKDESAQKEILQMYTLFETKMDTLGAIPVDTEDSIDNVVKKVLDIVN
jgi:broad-specificity NMP kinase